MDSPAAPVTTSLRDDAVLEVRLDDGGPGALRPEVLDALHAAVREHPDAPVLLRGRPGMFSAGLDLRWMLAEGPDGVGELLRACGRALAALWTHPRPVVVAATGHAIAAGTMLAATADHVVADTAGTWGLNETANGMEIPRFGILLASARLGPRDLDALLLTGARLDAARALAVGFVDEVASGDEVVERAEERLRDLAALPAAAYAGNKARLRGANASRLLAGLDADVDVLVAGMRAAAGPMPTDDRGSST
jgi:enoyl-CoA hydratase